MPRRERESRLGFALVCSTALHLAVPLCALLSFDLLPFSSDPGRSSRPADPPRELDRRDPSGGRAVRSTRADPGIPGVRLHAPPARRAQLAVRLVHLPPLPRPEASPVPAAPAPPKVTSRRRALPSSESAWLHLLRAPDGERPVRLARAGEAVSAEPRLELEAVQASTPQTEALVAQLAASPVPLGAGAGLLPGEGELAAGDPNEALIAARIAHVASLFVGAEQVRQHGRREAHLRFRIDSRGYVQDFVLQQPTHVRAFDESIEPVLHLAEPFPVAEREYEVALPFDAED